MVNMSQAHAQANKKAVDYIATEAIKLIKRYTEAKPHYKEYYSHMSEKHIKKVLRSLTTSGTMRIMPIGSVYQGITVNRSGVYNAIVYTWLFNEITSHNLAVLDELIATGRLNKRMVTPETLTPIVDKLPLTGNAHSLMCNHDMDSQEFVHGVLRMCDLLEFRVR